MGNKKQGRRKKPAKVEVEEDLLSKGRWSGYKEQQALQRQNHTAEENIVAREACRDLVEFGYGSDEEFMKWLLNLYGEK